jgi:hypothetical protein
MPNKRTILTFLAVFVVLPVVPVPSADAQVTGAAFPSTAPTTAPTGRPAQINAAGEAVVTFESAEVGKAIPSWTDGAVTFTLNSAPVHSRAQPRVMFFPHLKTERRGILNAMANEQATSVKAQIAGDASSVTLVLWGTIGCRAWLEAYDKDGKLLNRAALEDTVPQRKSPSEPIPSFELTVKARNIAYILFGGAIDGGALVADEMRYMPLRPAPGGQEKTTTNHPQPLKHAGANLGSVHAGALPQRQERSQQGRALGCTADDS